MNFIYYYILAVKLFLLAVVPAFSQGFDFFYFVQEWPGSYCDTKKGCCYPLTGKPNANFGIHGLWPNYDDGSYPSNCDPDSPFDLSEVEDLRSILQEEWPTLACPSGDGTKFWSHEWEKHGTCSESVLSQHSYFQTNLDLKEKINLLQVLKNAGIEPNGTLYSLGYIKNAIEEGVGFTPAIGCNVDPAGTTQLYRISFCVDNTASNLIECPRFPRSNCPSRVEFPSF
ncbi:extracellular ribonuclease LE [Beta vulgaris subsp. vulgaris]|uniref:extracellular ribonuclease LE n=1 Tax=Beta vulgaris subsp. vulgaris TaxID=3555 RepID=UPI00203704BF|nr:extracellular ribonuclease LE [Beta vulgaris subsp. vulgaris]